LLTPVVQEHDNNKSTELTLVGLGGDMQLQWSKSSPNVAETPVVLESVGSLLVRFDGRAILSEATLTIRSLGAKVDRVVVRLPADAELVPGRGGASNYTVTPLDLKDPANSKPSRLVEIRLAKKTTGPVDVRLSCSRPYDPATNQALCELAGFEVVGAVRQWGVVAVAVGSDWQVIWGTPGEPRQVDQIPESLRHDDVVACFEYMSQPFSLAARLVPRKSRVNVAPEYQLFVDRGQLRLEGKLTYTIRGAKVVALQVAMPGWELGEIGPDTLVAVDGITVDPAGTATIPLVQPTSGEITLQISAHRPLPENAKSMTVALPQPQGNSITSALVAVIPADNVEIIPNAVATEGLVRQRTEPPMKLPERQQEALFYRGTNGPAVFAADLRFHSQRITVDANSEISIGEHTVAVEQKYAYTVAYEPIDRLTIQMPRALIEADHFKILLDGKAISPAIEPERSSDRSSPTLPIRITLPRPRIGPCDLELQYTEPISNPGTESAFTLTVPLPMPGDGEISSNRAVVKAGNRVQTLLHPGPWAVPVSESNRAGYQGGLLASTTGRVGDIVLDVRREASTNPEATFVDRAWIQSWFSSTMRQDRAVFQFVTSRKELEITMPAGVAMQQVSMTLDGERVECRPLADNRWMLPLSTDGEPSRYVLEMRYHFPEAESFRGRQDIEFPRLGTDIWLRRVYWQLVLPPNEHVVVGPNGFTGEYRWGWHGYFWGRQSLLDQSQLEAWSGGSASRSQLPEGCSVYLFSTLGNSNRAQLYIAGRSWIVLWASGAALMIGLLLIYVPKTRHPAILLVLALGLISVGVIAPEPMLLLAQSAGLGMVLSLLAGLLDRGGTRQRVPMPISEITNIPMELGSTHTPGHPPVPMNPATTMNQTVPINQTGTINQTGSANPTSTQTMQVLPPQDPRNAET
jgi:hypothetical protein